MAGRSKKVVALPTNSLVASATRYTGKAGRIYQQTAEWQRECYRHYAICGEARFAAKFFGHALSRATLGVGRRVDGKIEDVTSGPAMDALHEMFAGSHGQPQMLSAIGTHLTIAGECFVVARAIQANEDVDGDPLAVGGTLWEVVSRLEMQVVGNKWTIKYGSGAQSVDLSDDDLVIRIWIPHPERRIEADSPFRSLLPILNEIEWLTRHIFAQLQSRLAGAGILFVPQGMTFPAPPATDGEQTIPSNEAEGLMLALADGMMPPIKDPGSPSAVIPIVITAPDESIDKVKLLHFWSELDAASLSMRSAAIHRFAVGMDMPPEQVEGMSSNKGTGGGASNGVSHWGAWQVEEATIKMHVEPMLELVVNALTVSYLRPAVETDEQITYNTAALRLRPDRSREAIELYNLGLISGEVVVRENGFDVADMMDDAERTVWLTIKVATGSATPEMVHAALGRLGVDFPAPSEAVPALPAPGPPTLEDHPSPQAPPGFATLLAASEALVFRALERSGNRLRTLSGVKPPGVPAYEVHTMVKANGTADSLLDDAWSCAPQVLAGVADVDQVVPVLSAYCQMLFAEQAPHDRTRLAAWLERGVA